MSNSSRTHNSMKNISASMVAVTAEAVCKFAVRAVFVRTLAQEYLGLEGLFVNILSLLSLMELGIAPAMSYLLYKPVAEHDAKTIQSLMRFYKKAYQVIGMAVAVIGASLTPFLPYLMKELPDNIPYLSVIYLLFVVNAAISYFMAYKQALIIAHQQNYRLIYWRNISIMLQSILQIGILLLTRNFILYLCIQILATRLTNLYSARQAEKQYPEYLKEKDTRPLSRAVLRQMWKSISAMFLHKIGGKIVFATDMLIISKYVGLVATGLYSNYTLIVNAVTSMLEKVFSGMVASVGNLNVSADPLHVRQVFYRVLFFNFWSFGFCSICLMGLLQGFIPLWLGKGFLLDFSCVLVLVADFYLNGMRKTVLLFRDASGAYYYDRYKPIFECVINIVVSILLVKQYGIIGVKLGTLVSTVTTSLWVEPYVLYKHVFHEKMWPYFGRLGLYTAATVLAGSLTLWLCSLLPAGGTLPFAGKMFICALLPNIVFLLLFFRTQEFGYFRSLVTGMVRRRLRR